MNGKKFKNTTVSVAEDAALTIGEVLKPDIQYAYEFNGEVRLHLNLSVPAGKIQQQQMYVGTGGNWVNVGDPISFPRPGAIGFDISLLTNTAVQYVYSGPA